MCKYPYIQFFPADWIADTRILSLSARAVWLELILAMHQRGRVGTLTGTTERLAGLCGCSAAEMNAALKELESTGTADVLRDCYGNVTVTCRRMQTEQAERVRAADGMRVTRKLRKRYANVTPDSTEDRVQRDKKNSADAGAHVHDETQEPDSDFPHSVEDVIEMSKAFPCSLPCSRETAEAYFTDRVARDWIPHGQMFRLKNRTQIGMDLKKWIMRDNNERKKEEKRNGKYLNNDPAKFGTMADEPEF